MSLQVGINFGVAGQVATMALLAAIVLDTQLSLAKRHRQSVSASCMLLAPGATTYRSLSGRLGSGLLVFNLAGCLVELQSDAQKTTFSGYLLQ